MNNRPAGLGGPAGCALYAMILFGDIIFTPRLKLRRLTNEDLPLLVAWSNSEAAHGAYLSPERLTEESGRSRLENGILWAGNNKLFMIESREGIQVGIIHYWLRSERTECAVVKVQIAVPEQRGKGYGTEAQKYLVINLFERMKVSEVEMYIDINNKAQQRCLAKLGFELVESLTYNDHQVTRLGHLFRLRSTQFRQNSVYQYHYE